MVDFRFRPPQGRLPLGQPLRTTQDLPRNSRCTRRRIRQCHVLVVDAHRPIPSRSSESRFLPPSQARYLYPRSTSSLPLARLPMLLSAVSKGRETVGPFDDRCRRLRLLDGIRGFEESGYLSLPLLQSVHVLLHHIASQGSN